jgi:hypothetical protein
MIMRETGLHVMLGRILEYVRENITCLALVRQHHVSS